MKWRAFFTSPSSLVALTPSLAQTQAAVAAAVDAARLASAGTSSSSSSTTTPRTSGRAAAADIAAYSAAAADDIVRLAQTVGSTPLPSADAYAIGLGPGSSNGAAAQCAEEDAAAEAADASAAAAAAPAAPSSRLIRPDARSGAALIEDADAGASSADDEGDAAPASASGPTTRAVSAAAAAHLALGLIVPHALGASRGNSLAASSGRSSRSGTAAEVEAEAWTALSLAGLGAVPLTTPLGVAAAKPVEGRTTGNQPERYVAAGSLEVDTEAEAGLAEGGGFQMGGDDLSAEDCHNLSTVSCRLGGVGSAGGRGGARAAGAGGAAPPGPGDFDSDSPTASTSAAGAGAAGAAVAAAIGAARGGSSAPSTATAAGAASMDNFPPLWVTRWVDYTSKYGLGYVLSDGTFGVMFNDATKMVQSPGAEEDPGADNTGGGAGGDRLVRPGYIHVTTLVVPHTTPLTLGSQRRFHDGVLRVDTGPYPLEYRERTRRSVKPAAAPAVVFAASSQTPEAGAYTRSLFSST